VEDVGNETEKSKAPSENDELILLPELFKEILLVFLELLMEYLEGGEEEY